MKTELEIREEIEKVTKDYWHVLDCYPATTQINAPRALMQVEAKAKLGTLYSILHKKRPKFKCDEFNKLDY